MVGDTTQLGSLLESLDDIESVAGDSGYLSHRNCMLIEAKGATPYLKPQKTQSNKDNRPTSMETYDTILQEKPKKMDETLPQKIHGRNRFLSNQTNTRPPSHLHQKRPSKTRTHDQSNRLQPNILST